MDLSQRQLHIVAIARDPGLGLGRLCVGHQSLLCSRNLCKNDAKSRILNLSARPPRELSLMPVVYEITSNWTDARLQFSKDGHLGLPSRPRHGSVAPCSAAPPCCHSLEAPLPL